MNKIVLQFGLLVFFLSIIFFSQQGLELHSVLLRSFVVFSVITTMLSIFVIIFIRAINKTAFDREKNLHDNLVGNNKHE